MSNEQKPGDPADKAADGAFGGVQSHRAGYGDDRLARLIDWLRAHPTATLASGEGALLLAENDRLGGRLAAAEAERNVIMENGSLHVYWQSAPRESLMDALAFQGAITKELLKKNETLNRILAALREPSENVSKAVWSTWGLWDSQNHFAATLHALVRAAVIAAEQEVGNE